MCGIAGCLGPPAAARHDLAPIAARMAEALASRGPDDAGVWVDPQGGVALGHRRLAVLDTSEHGHQPMVSRDGRYVLVYNGEVYNFRELAKDLEGRGHGFRGSGDTEVLLAGFSEWGVVSTLDRCIGMFAFGLWDRTTRTLTLGRDRLGIKPLYWGRFGSTFLFGSELKALRAHPDFEARIDRSSAASFMRHSYIAAPNSIYEGVRKLEPGCTLTLRPGEEPRGERYWDMRALALRASGRPLTVGDEEAVETLQSLLRDAVGRRMIADVPLGAFLSGGIDSSTIVSLMQERSERPVRTFTIGFKEQADDESVHAALVARHLGTDHTELIVKPDDLFDLLPQMPDVYDEPFADSSQLPTFLLSRLTRASVTVALSGDGGDELFAGYNKYFKLERRLRRGSRLPLPLRRTLAGAMGALARSLEAGARRVPRAGALAKSARRVSREWVARDADALYEQIASRWDDPVALVSGAEGENQTILRDAGVAVELPDPVTRMQFFDTVGYLPDDILTKVDRASMAVGLEVRVPLLDHRLVELCWSLPRRMKLRDGVRKWLLRRLLYRHVPRDLVERPKKGFGIPLDAWLRGPLRDWAEDLLSERSLRSAGVLEPEPIRRVWSHHLAGFYDSKRPLWNALMLQAWCRRWM